MICRVLKNQMDVHTVGLHTVIECHFTRSYCFFFFQAEDGIRDVAVTGVQTCALPIYRIGRGMRRYGAAMIGAGGGLVYLGLWAAAGPYALMERRIRILLLAATTGAGPLLALHHQIEGPAIWALAGADPAPVHLQTAAH